MANFPKSPPAIGRSTGLVGATGATGAAGSGAVVTSVDSLSGTPRAVTDWGPIIQTAIGAGTRAFQFGPFDYPFLTGVTVGGSTAAGVYFLGTSSGFAGFTSYAAGTSRLIWGATGTGHLFSETDSLYAGQPGGVSFRDLAFIYTQSGYTGTLFWPQWSFHWEFDHCFFSSAWPAATGGGSLTTATAAIQTDSVNTLTIRNCVFDNSFAKAALYRANPAAGFANVIRCIDTTFNAAAYVNPNLDNVFDHCIFEGMTQWIVSSDTSVSVGQPSQVAFHDCALWDPAAATGGIVGNCMGNVWRVLIDGVIDHANALNLAAYVDMSNAAANSVLSIKNSNVQNLIMLPNGDTGGAHFFLIDLTDIDFSSGTTGLIPNLYSQGAAVSMKGCRGKPVSELGEQANNIGHEQIQNLGASFTQYGPTFTPVAANHTIFASAGNDTAGWVQIRNGGGGVGATGVLADVTFFNTYHTNNGGAGVPLVQLFPFTSTDNATWYTNAALFYSAQVVGVGVAAAQKFRIVINGTGLPAGATISIGYRVIYL